AFGFMLSIFQGALLEWDSMQKAQMTRLAWTYYICYVCITLCFYASVAMFLSFFQRDGDGVVFAYLWLVSQMRDVASVSSQVGRWLPLCFVIVLASLVLFHVFEPSALLHYGKSHSSDIILEPLATIPSSLRQRNKVNGNSDGDGHVNDDVSLVKGKAVGVSADVNEEEKTLLIAQANHTSTQNQSAFPNTFQSRTRIIKLKPPHRVSLSLLTPGNLTNKFRNAFSSDGSSDDARQE
ncbi:hypothetical protein RFI_03329, partial [Reticulomyxa filosa]